MKLTGIIGVISITIIVIIVAAFTFAHVESIREQQNKKNDQSMDGWVHNISLKETIEYMSKSVDVYRVTLSNTSDDNDTLAYNMIFIDSYPPYVDVHLRFFFDQVTQQGNTYFLIHEIEKLG